LQAVTFCPFVYQIVTTKLIFYASPSSVFQMYHGITLQSCIIAIVQSYKIPKIFNEKFPRFSIGGHQKGRAIADYWKTKKAERCSV
jgi:hypothetical protein